MKASKAIKHLQEEIESLNQELFTSYFARLIGVDFDIHPSQ